LHEFDLHSLTSISWNEESIEGAASKIMEQMQIETYTLENQILHMYDEKN